MRRALIPAFCCPLDFPPPLANWYDEKANAK